MSDNTHTMCIYTHLYFRLNLLTTHKKIITASVINIIIIVIVRHTVYCCYALYFGSVSLLFTFLFYFFCFFICCCNYYYYYYHYQFTFTRHSVYKSIVFFIPPTEYNKKIIRRKNAGFLFNEKIYDLRLADSVYNRFSYSNGIQNKRFDTRTRSRTAEKNENSFYVK